MAQEVQENIYLQLAIALALSVGVSVYLVFYTTLLGPYGSPQDVYHLVILAAVLFGTVVGVLRYAEEPR